MLFVTAVPDVKCPCFVYYVWGLGEGGGAAGIRDATALMAICIMCWEDRTLVQHIKHSKFTVSLFRMHHPVLNTVLCTWINFTFPVIFTSELL